MMGEILDIVVEVLKTDEDQGTQALESLIELTQSFGEIWNASSEKLLYVLIICFLKTDQTSSGVVEFDSFTIMSILLKMLDDQKERI